MTTVRLPSEPPALTPAVSRSLLALLRDLEHLDAEEAAAKAAPSTTDPDRQKGSRADPR